MTTLVVFVFVIVFGLFFGLLDLVLAGVVVAFSRYGAEFRRFVELARIELRKVVWPTRNETGMTTLVVFGFVVVAGVFFWLVDMLLALVTRHLTGQGG